MRKVSNEINTDNKIQEDYAPLLSDETKMYITEDCEPVARVVVCAANRYDRLIVCGARHCDSIMRAQVRAAGIKNRTHEQGFIDQWGNFLNRELAMKIVRENGQKFELDRNGGSNKILFSEGLY